MENTADKYQSEPFPFGVDLVNQIPPIRVVQSLELGNVLLVLLLDRERDGDHVGRAQASNIQLNVPGDERVVERARRPLLVKTTTLSSSSARRTGRDDSCRRARSIRRLGRR